MAQRRLLISVIVPVGGAVVLALLALAYWHFHMAPVSRRLIGAAKGAAANQKDLPYELRGRFEAVAVLGSGAFGVVLEAWQLSGGHRTTRRAVKVVHARHRGFDDKELRRLNREVRDRTASARIGDLTSRQHRRSARARAHARMHARAHARTHSDARTLTPTHMCARVQRTISIWRFLGPRPRPTPGP